MSLSHEQLMELHDTAYERGQFTRDAASNDLVFTWITQWDDALLSTSDLQYKGEFNIIRKAIRHITTQIHTNPVQVDFEPIGNASDDDADIADGLYRASCRHNVSIEAFDNAADEAIACGVGAWELVNEEDDDAEGGAQKVSRWPLHEACNTVFWDANARLLDKSDADWCSILTPYSDNGYEKLHEELTGEPLEAGFVAANFAQPNKSWNFPWIGTQKQIWVGRFYHREKVTTKYTTWRSLLGEERELSQDEIDAAMEEELAEGQFEEVSSREETRYVVTRYIASGIAILEETVVPGQHIPVVPVYGERAYVEGEEHYEGVVRLAKDPQRLRNFQMAYLQEIVGRSPRPKEIYTPEQLQGHQHMYEESGADNNYPYLLQNLTDVDGNPLPLGPVGRSGEQTVPVALAQAMALTREAVEDVANPGLPQDIADPDISGKAVIALQNRLDQQSYVYQKNFKHAKRRDGEIFASMMADIYDTPRKVTLYGPDETRRTMELMQEQYNAETWEKETINDVRGKRFRVYASIGMAYENQKQEARESLEKIIATTGEGDPLRSIATLKLAMLTDGSDMKDMRNYARKQLILQGIVEPETDEEKALLEQSQQTDDNQQDPALMLAMAEMQNAQAEKEKAQSDLMDSQTRVYEAQTKRMQVEVDARKAGIDARRIMADTDKKSAETQGVQIDNMGKLREQQTRELTLDLATGMISSGAG